MQKLHKISLTPHNYKNIASAGGLYKALCDLIDQPFGIFPSQTRIGDRFSVAVLAYFLAARLDIALDHHSLYKAAEF